MGIGKDILDRMKSSKSSDGDAADSEEPGEGSDLEESYDSAGTDALDEMADALGLDGDAAGKFKTAMADYVKACMGEGGGK
jgi:hypothetical protein